MNRLTDNVYYMDFVQQSDRPVLGVIIGEKCSFLVDAGNSIAHAKEMLSKIRGLGVPRIQYVGYTHWHWDHIFGGVAIDGIHIFQEETANKLNWLRTLEWTNAAIESRVRSGEEIQFCYDHIKVEFPDDNRGIEIPHADLTFLKKLTIDLGDQLVELHHVGGDHSADQVIIFSPKEKVLFLGDCLYFDMYNGEWSYHRSQLFPLLEQLVSFDAEYFVPAHHTLYRRNEFISFKNRLVDLGNIVGDEIDLASVTAKFQAEKSRVPKEDELEDMKAFIEGNIKRKGAE